MLFSERWDDEKEVLAKRVRSLNNEELINAFKFELSKWEDALEDVPNKLRLVEFLIEDEILMRMYR